MLQRVVGQLQIKVEQIKGLQVGNNNKQVNNFGIQYPQEIVIEKVEKQLSNIKQSRFLVGNLSAKKSQRLATKLMSGELVGCNDELKARALSWCARILVREQKQEAVTILKQATRLSDTDDVKLAEAFLLSSEGDKNGALSILSKINTPQSNTASFHIVSHHSDFQSACDWLTQAELTFTDLDQDGKFSFLSHHLESGNWNVVYESITAITTNEYQQNPALYYLVAIANLSQAVPEEGKAYLLHQVPAFSDTPLADDIQSLQKRRTATENFLNCAAYADKLECEQSANHMKDYALWLSLKDPESQDDAIERLKRSLSHRQHRLRRIPLAMQFGLKVDLNAIDIEIEKSIARTGKVSPEVALARFAISLRGTAKNIVSNITKFRHQFCDYVNKKCIDAIEIEALAKSGVPSQAFSRLDELVKEGIPKQEEQRLRNIINTFAGNDPTGELKTLYQETGMLTDLALLVEKLETDRNWEELAHFAELLFTKIHSCKNAICFATSLYHVNKVDELLAFLAEYPEFIKQSEVLVTLQASSLYMIGELAAARKILENIEKPVNKQWVNEVFMLIAIASGDWESLHGLIENEWRDREDRTVNSLMKTAQVAQSIQSTRTQALVESAVSKNKNDPYVFLSAYSIATHDGWEDSKLVNGWLQQAMELSTSEGPIKKYNTREVMEMQPDWAQQEEDTFAKLSNNEIPIILYANASNRSLVENLLLPMLANTAEKDVRKRSFIPSYSGARQRQESGLETIESVAFDATALLNIGYLGLFDFVSRTFKQIIIPHSTMSWLFSEQQKVRFHQPSRIANAKELRRLIQNNELDVFSFDGVPDIELSNEVGIELGSMISVAAENNRVDPNSQHLVVVSHPVHKVDSFLEENADLSKYDGLLCCCKSIVLKINAKALLNKSEFERAMSYLTLRKQESPVNIEVQEGATLYLDSVAVTYLRQVGVLDKLSSAGLKVFISSDKLQDSDALINFEHLVDKASTIIDKLRKDLAEGITNGKVKLGKQECLGDEGDSELLNHPAISAITLVDKVDAVFVDDRFFNKQLSSNIISTQELLQTLESRAVITLQQYCEYQIKLRNAALGFIPVTEKELSSALDTAMVENDKLVESTGLKAIRENILKAQMSQYLQCPEEGFWLANMLNIFIAQINNLWNKAASDTEAKAKSKWLIDFIDVRGWAHRFDYDTAIVFVTDYFIRYIMLLLLAPHGANAERKSTYWAWLEEVFLPKIEGDSLLQSKLIEHAKTIILNEVENSSGEKFRMELKGEGFSPNVAKQILADGRLKMFSPKLQSEMLPDPSFCSRLGIETTNKINVGDGVVFNSKPFYQAIRSIYGDKNKSVELIDNNEVTWLLQFKLDSNYEGLLLTQDGKVLNLPSDAELSPILKERLDCLENRGHWYNLPHASLNKWRKILSSRALKNEEQHTYFKDIEDTVIFVSDGIWDEIKTGTFTVQSFVPDSFRYFQRMAGIIQANEQYSLHEFTGVEFKVHCKNLLDWQQVAGAIQALQLCSNPLLSYELQRHLMALSVNNIIEIYQFIATDGDRMSQVAAIEIGFGLLQTCPKIEPLLTEIIGKIYSDDPDKPQSEFKLLSNWIILVEAAIARNRVLSKIPVFMKRMACISQASIITKHFLKVNVDIDNLSTLILDKVDNNQVLQGLIDVRFTPRWLPEYISPKRLREHGISRMHNAAEKYGKANCSSSLQDAIDLVNPPAISLPGPVDDETASINKLPPELRKVLFEQIKSVDVEARSFIPLIKFGIIYELDIADTEEIVNWLRTSQYQLKNIDSYNEEFNFLHGLANLAATTRSIELATEIRTLLRVLRRKPGSQLTLDNSIRICLMASAAHLELKGWCHSVGEWLTEFTFENLTVENAAGLHAVIVKLCQLVPELWITLGRAEAALKTAMALKT